MPRNPPAPLLATLQSTAAHVAVLCKVVRPDGDTITLTTWGTPLDVDLDGHGELTYAVADMQSVAAFQAQINGPIDDAELVVNIDGSTFIADDMRRTFFAGASVSIGYVDPLDLANPWLHRKYEMGQVKVNGPGASFELLGPEKRLEQPVGVPLTANCRFKFGDEDCGVSLAHLKIIDTVTAVTNYSTFAAAGGIIIYNDYFGAGELRWLTGLNTGEVHRIKTDDGAGNIVLQLDCLDLPAIGDTFEATPGCRKRLKEDCVEKWNNGDRFGGFPFLAPENVTATAPKSGKKK